MSAAHAPSTGSLGAGRPSRRFDRGAAKAQFASDPQQAFQTLLAAARRGYLDAQTAVGLALLNGHECQQDVAAACRWFSLAAMHGHAEAINLAGRCSMFGWGTNADPAKGAACYRLAADAGHAWAQFNYAECLFSGEGVAVDRDLAMTYYARAADQGNAKAMNMLARAHEEGWNRPVDIGRARTLYQLAADAGDFRAQFNLALLFLDENADAAGDRQLRLAIEGAHGEALAGMAEFLESSNRPALMRHVPAARARLALMSGGAFAQATSGQEGHLAGRSDARELPLHGGRRSPE